MQNYRENAVACAKTGFFIKTAQTIGIVVIAENKCCHALQRLLLIRKSQVTGRPRTIKNRTGICVLADTIIQPRRDFIIIIAIITKCKGSKSNDNNILYFIIHRRQKNH